MRATAMRRGAGRMRRVAVATATVAALVVASALAAHGTFDTGGDAPGPMGAAPRQEPAGPPVTIAAEALPTPPATTERVSVGSGDGQANGPSGGLSELVAGANGDQSISADGRWVAFVSLAENLAGGGVPGGTGLFLRDRQARTTEAIPYLDGGPIPQGYVVAEPSISADGSVIAFTVVVPPGSNDIFATTELTPFVLAWERGQPTEIVSYDDTGQVTAGYQPSVSADGNYVAYTRWAPVTPTTPPPTASPRLNHAPSIANLTATPVCIPDLVDGLPVTTSTVRVHASDPDGDGLTVRIQLHWYDPSLTHYVRSPVAMEFEGGDTWKYEVTTDALAGYGWSFDIRYDVTARDALGADSPTLSDDLNSTNNHIQYLPEGCSFL